MSAERVLIIGGAGFIGSHTADYLSAKGYTIIILDNLHPKNHDDRFPGYLAGRDYELHRGNITDADVLLPLLREADYVFVFAAEMDLNPAFQRFMNVNVGGTGLVYELIVNHKLNVKKVVVASSQFAYGEGVWNCREHGPFNADIRSLEQMKQQQWDVQCPVCKASASYVNNVESQVLNPSNHYSLSKYFQEQLALRLGRLHRIPTTALRYSIVHGPRQSLKNTYSGALRTFALSYMAGIPFATFEDNLSMRDFISVKDVVTANFHVMQDSRSDFQVYNVGSSVGYTIKELASFVCSAFGSTPVFSDVVEFRLGDTRHSISNCQPLQALGWSARELEKDVVADYINWFKTQQIDIDNFVRVQRDIREKGTVLQAG